MSHAWMPLYVADYLADTTSLSTVEHGAYMLLIMHYWQHGGLPEQDPKLARICRMTPAEWQEIKESISDLFGSDWTHKRIDEELAKADELVAKRSAAGKAAADAKKTKRETNEQPIVDQTLVQTTTHSPSPSPSPKGSEANASGADAPIETLDPKTILFRRGLQTLAALTDRKPEQLRPTLGRWMKLTGDDAGAVLAEIEHCRGSPPADPIAWIESRLKPKEAFNGKRGRVSTAEQAAAAMGDILAEINGRGRWPAEPAPERDCDRITGPGDAGPRREFEASAFNRF